ncbi:MAG: group 1 glycosyl transferase, partial [Flavitalea sp.]
ANRFFDYLHAGIPQLCIDFPVYRQINKIYNFAVLINKPDVQNITDGLNRLLEDTALYESLQQNCLKARTILNWQEEEKTLIAFYKKLTSSIG